MEAIRVRRRGSFEKAVLAAALAAIGGLAGCAPERRAVGPAAPSTAPTGPNDPRAAAIEGNLMEISAGGRQFRWAGCGACHSLAAVGPVRLDDGAWRCGGATAQIYIAIAQGCGPGMPAYGARLTPEQTWRLAAYVRSLAKTQPGERRRADNALAGEPKGRRWQGPLR